MEQGYIASTGKYTAFSEGVIVTYDPEIIPLETLVEIHLFTHKSTSSHSFREKYRSAVYFMNLEDAEKSEEAIAKLQQDFLEKIITQILPYKDFKASRDSLQDYYLKNPEKPFCQKYIHPKLELLRKDFSRQFEED